MNKLCVAFDLDDTLYLERDYVRSGFQWTGSWAHRHLGITNLAERAWALFEAGRRGDIFDEALRQSGAPWNESTVARLVEHYRKHHPDICLLPDALECLRALKGTALLAVISDGPRETQQNKIVALGLDEWADVILLTAEFGTNCAKPSPLAFLRLQELSGCRAGQCWYVADNPKKDFIAPRRLEWKTIRIRREGGLYSTLEAEGAYTPELEISNLTEFLNLFSKTRTRRLVP